ncbi:hypothetical protein Taro_031452 [Colocasia esculenta]|uniref:Uncharacterized protein n=1 Tax=Colocasia esculenta TaxID=4460 RepID=A0A843VRZ3_COLES|nr:hypothetical protein [Colocasia esculenta]
MGAGSTDVFLMGFNDNGYSQAVAAAQAEEETDLRRGPWTVEEDLTLVNYITNHGEGRWNSLARSAGLKRTGKSCRLRWLNYLRPDVRRGNITPEEQLLILELHSRWGNRWSKIAQQLPGRTDNEIKNYWRTRVQKHAKQLKCDVNSQKFKDMMRYLWMPRLMERISAASADAATANPGVSAPMEPLQPAAIFDHVKLSPDNSSMDGSWSELSAVTDHLSSTPVSDVIDHCMPTEGGNIVNGVYGGEFPTGQAVGGAGGYSDSFLSPSGYLNQGFPDFEQSGWGGAGDFSSEDLWSDDDFCFLQEQLQY